MKDVMIKITGSQCIDDKEEDQMEFVTEGKLYQRNGYIYMVYEETEVSGMAGCKTTLRVKGDSLRLKRIGNIGFDHELYFEKGQRFSSLYETPYGTMDMEVLTKSVDNRLDLESMKGTIDIRYDISLQGVAEGKNKLEIKVM